jgi:putative Holliday junction resolvase
MRVLGLDVGTKTIGVAVSDEMGWTAQGIETIKIADEQMEQSYPRL